MTRLATRLTAFLLAALTALAAQAQSQEAPAPNYPSFDNVWVNDRADVLSDAAEGRIAAQLQALDDDTGVQATVLTLPTRWGYGGASVEDFATGLFNHWSIGDAERNDGILVLVVPYDREMRVELGSGYGNGYDAVAQQVIDEVFVPAFGQYDFEGGIEAGVAALVDQIARPHAAGAAPAPASASASSSVAEGEGSDSGSAGGLGILGAVIAGLVGWAAFGRRLTDRFKRCSSCGARGVHSRREVLEKPTRTQSGRGMRIVTCPHCGHEARHAYAISKRTSSSSRKSFGGGRSSGGGASGRW